MKPNVLKYLGKVYGFFSLDVRTFGSTQLTVIKKALQGSQPHRPQHVSAAQHASWCIGVIALSASQVGIYEEFRPICCNCRAIKHSKVFTANLYSAQWGRAVLHIAFRPHRVPAEIIKQSCTPHATVISRFWHEKLGGCHATIFSLVDASIRSNIKATEPV